MWKEEEHPRDEAGKFTNSGAKEYRQNTSYEDISMESKDKLSIEQEDISPILGVEYKGYKGQSAVEKLLEEKQGYIRGAFVREDIGEIDLLWGNSDLGLQHIIERRSSQGISIDSFLQDISNVVQNGRFRKKNNRGNFEFMLNDKIAVVSPELKGNKLTFLLTAFKTHSKK